jgi:hypothetical protein
VLCPPTFALLCRPGTPPAASSSSPQSRLRLGGASLPDDDDAAQTPRRNYRHTPLEAEVAVVPAIDTTSS